MEKKDLLLPFFPITVDNTHSLSATQAHKVRTLFSSGPSVYALTVKLLSLAETLSASHSSKQHIQISISHLDCCNILSSNLDKYSHALLISIHSSASKIIFSQTIFSGCCFDHVIPLSVSTCLAPCYIITSNISISSLPWTIRVYPQPMCHFSIDSSHLWPIHDVSILLQLIRYPSMNQLPISILREFSVQKSLLNPPFFAWYLQKPITLLLY